MTAMCNLVLANITFDRIAGSRSLAPTGQRERRVWAKASAWEGVRFTPSEFEVLRLSAVSELYFWDCQLLHPGVLVFDRAGCQQLSG